MKYLAGIMVLANSYSDIRKREIYWHLTLVWTLVGIVYQIVTVISSGHTEPYNLIMICACAILAVILRKIDIGIGAGDGMILLAMSLNLAVWQMIESVLLALLAVGIFALVLMVIFKKDRKMQIPFVPFLAVALWIELIGEWL